MNREIKAEAALQLISRATNVTGKMLQGLSEDYRYKTGSRVAAWISRLGLVIWNLVAVAVPDTLRNLFFRHALGLLYLFDFALIFGGILFNAPVKALGWEMLGFTIVLHLVTATLADYMSGKRIGLWIARIAIAVSLIGLIICGALLFPSAG